MHVTYIIILLLNASGKEFIHEKDRLYHAREEHQKELDYRTHRDEYTQHKVKPPQEQVNEQMRNFGDNF